MKERGNSIVLIGFMGAGKSSVGRALAARTGLPRFDTDEMVAARFGQPIAKIFETRGEAAFRQAESDALAELDGKERGIIVTGGGIVLRAENIALLKELGTVVSLEADEETLFRRVSRRQTRPLLQTADPRATLHELFTQRAPLYHKAADVRVDTSHLSHDQVASEILQKIGTL
jgi:shikimate kinase